MTSPACPVLMGAVQHVLARGLWLFRAFLRASITPVGMNTLPGIQALSQYKFCIFRWLYKLTKWSVFSDNRMQKTVSMTRQDADSRALGRRPLRYLLMKSDLKSKEWMHRKTHSSLTIIQSLFQWFSFRWGDVKGDKIGALFGAEMDPRRRQRLSNLSFVYLMSTATPR